MKRLLIGLGLLCALATALVAAPQAKPAPKASASPTPKPAASPSPSPQAAPVPPGAPAPPAAPAAPKAEDEPKVLYSIGYVLGRETVVFALTPAEAEEVKKGFADSLANKDAAVQLETFGPQIRPFAQARMTKKLEQEKEKGRAFADQALKEPGASKSDSGMVYIEKSKGTGAVPKATDKVRVHYHGTFADGKVFDTTQGRDPAELNVNGVIPCWTEGLQKMAVGGKARLVCPSATAYGDAGRPGIAGGATLVFDLELLDVLSSTTTAPPALPPAAATPTTTPAAPTAPAPKASPAATPKPSPAAKPSPSPSPKAP
jgi:FKBP-type peptidyl-prolyl cis-trans isomerase FkpA